MEKLGKHEDFQVSQIEFEPHFCGGGSINFRTIKISLYLQLHFLRINQIKR
jgi:hypothetical protein